MGLIFHKLHITENIAADLNNFYIYKKYLKDEDMP